MSAPDWWNLLAQEKFNAPEGWQWTKLQAHGGDGLPREKCLSEVSGCVVTLGPEVFKSGPRKGQKKKKYDEATRRTFFVTFGDLDAFCLEWERKTGKFHNCGGDGQQLWRWSREKGEETKTCSRCHGDGKARP